jgi:hypothetical protein
MEIWLCFIDAENFCTYALCSDNHNFCSVYQIWAYENYWKVEEVNYKFDIESFLRLYLVWRQNCKFLRLLKAAQHRISAVQLT